LASYSGGTFVVAPTGGGATGCFAIGAADSDVVTDAADSVAFCSVHAANQKAPHRMTATQPRIEAFDESILAPPISRRSTENAASKVRKTD
jgi:hypothetical protein